MQGDDGIAGQDGATEVVLVAEATPLRDEARLGVLAAGRRIAAELDWATAASGLSERGLVAAILVETDGVDPARLGAVLPAIDAHARSLAIPLIIAVGMDQLDLIASISFDPPTRLLCDPTLSDRIAELALATAGGGGAGLHEPVRGGEAARLQRLNQEVARIADALARLARGEDAGAGRGGTVADRSPGYHAPPAEPAAVTAAEVRNAIRARRLRDQFFGPGLFEDPAWDMLLDLFAAELEGMQVSVSSLCIAAAVAATTALRWVSRLTEGGWLERRPDPDDRRRAFMALTPRARDAMGRYCAAMQRAGLPIG